MPDTGKTLLLVGCGKMGGAMLRGIAAANLASSIMVVEPSASPNDIKAIPGIVWKNAPGLIEPSFMPDAILIAVKPQAMADVLPSYACFKDTVFLSIAAGMTLAKLAEILKNPRAAIVRSMPNLPASIGQGITVAIASPQVSTAQRELCDRLLNAVGKTAWVDDESLLDVITALSGSGPAYVFALCEAMAKAGAVMGLQPHVAEELARQTIIGSGALLAQSLESAGDLRRAVTSPKGTTEAALTQLLSEQGLNTLVRDAMMAAVRRAKELAQ